MEQIGSKTSFSHLGIENSMLNPSSELDEKKFFQRCEFLRQKL